MLVISLLLRNRLERIPAPCNRRQALMLNSACAMSYRHPALVSLGFVCKIQSTPDRDWGSALLASTHFDLSLATRAERSDTAVLMGFEGEKGSPNELMVCIACWGSEYSTLITCFMQTITSLYEPKTGLQGKNKKNNKIYLPVPNPLKAVPQPDKRSVSDKLNAARKGL